MVATARDRNGSFDSGWSRRRAKKRDQGVEALRAKYAPKLEAIQEQIRRAREKLEREQAQASRTTWDATIALGSSVLGAILGRKTISKTNVGRATSAAKAATRAAQQRGDVSQAASSLDSLRQKYDDLQAKFQSEIESMAAALRPEALVLEPAADSSQENRYHRRKGRPGLDAVSSWRARDASKRCIESRGPEHGAGRSLSSARVDSAVDPS